MSNDIATYAAIYFFASAVLSTYIHNEWEHSTDWQRWLSCLEYALLAPVWMLIWPLIRVIQWLIAKAKRP